METKTKIKFILGGLIALTIAKGPTTPPQTLQAQAVQIENPQGFLSTVPATAPTATQGSPTAPKIVEVGPLTATFIKGAQNCPKLEWKYLAGIARIETNYGTHGGAKVDQNMNITKEIKSHAGARGPMQHMPASWATYGKGGDINNFNDAAAASARHLCAGGIIDGTPQGIYKALRRYYTGKTRYTKDGNWYADKVFKYADAHNHNM